MIQRTNLLLSATLWFFVACSPAFAQGIVLDPSPTLAPNPMITQGRTLIPDLSSRGTVPYAITRDIFNTTAVEHGRMGLFRRRACITLELDRERLTGTVREGLDRRETAVVWEFSNDYYFPNLEIERRQADVVAWAPFLAVAKVVRGDAARPVAVYADWVKPSELQLTNTGGCQ